MLAANHIWTLAQFGVLALQKAYGPYDLPFVGTKAALDPRVVDAKVFSLVGKTDALLFVPEIEHLVRNWRQCSEVGVVALFFGGGGGGNGHLTGPKPRAIAPTTPRSTLAPSSTPSGI